MCPHFAALPVLIALIVPDVCRFAFALLLALDCLVYNIIICMFHVLIVMFILVLNCEVL